MWKIHRREGSVWWHCHVGIRTATTSGRKFLKLHIDGFEEGDGRGEEKEWGRGENTEI
jgi:hypothetical protein